MRLYFDENFSSHLAHGFREFQRARPGEDIEVFHLTDEFPRGEKDEVWLPALAQRHGCILTQDLNIERTRLLWRLCRENKIGVFFFRQPKKHKFDFWGWTSKVFEVWPDVKEKARVTPKPFAFYIEPTRSKLLPADN